MLDHRFGAEPPSTGGGEQEYVIASIVGALYSLGATLYVPHLFSTYATRYGVIGAVFAIISTLFCVMVFLVGSARSDARSMASSPASAAASARPTTKSAANGTTSSTRGDRAGQRPARGSTAAAGATTPVTLRRLVPVAEARMTRADGDRLRTGAAGPPCEAADTTRAELPNGRARHVPTQVVDAGDATRLLLEHFAGSTWAA